MQVNLHGVDIGLALAKGPATDIMVILATLADEDMQSGGDLVADVAARRGAEPYHGLVAPFLRMLADAIDGGDPRHPATGIGA